jgi:hypothetical protein
MTMQTENIVLDRGEALRLYRKYREHRHYSQPVDLEIQRVYQAIAKGQVVIKALSSIIGAGVGDDGLPKLAICRADATMCFVEMRSDGGARMSADRWPKENHNRRYIDFAAGSFPGNRTRRAGQAIMPLVPINLRPKRGIENYHVLFEAVWQPVPPVDPMLLRRIGKADLWLVVAAWELTEVERTVLASRV